MTKVPGRLTLLECNMKPCAWFGISRGLSLGKTGLWLHAGSIINMSRVMTEQETYEALHSKSPGKSGLLQCDEVRLPHV